MAKPTDSSRPYAVKAARGFGPIHDRMKGPDLAQGERTGRPQAMNLPKGFRDGKRGGTPIPAQKPPLPKLPTKRSSKGK